MFAEAAPLWANLYRNINDDGLRNANRLGSRNFLAFPLVASNFLFNEHRLAAEEFTFFYCNYLCVGNFFPDGNFTGNFLLFVNDFFALLDDDFAAALINTDALTEQACLSGNAERHNRKAD